MRRERLNHCCILLCSPDSRVLFCSNIPLKHLSHPPSSSPSWCYLDATYYYIGGFMAGLLRLTKRICLLVSSEKPVELGYYIIIYLGQFWEKSIQSFETRERRHDHTVCIFVVNEWIRKYINLYYISTSFLKKYSLKTVKKTTLRQIFLFTPE